MSSIGHKTRAIPDDFPDIADYALIGNCRTAALVSSRGSVEWLCVPTFSGPSLFGAILDRDAGHFSVSPTRRHRTRRAYVEGTNVLRTTFETAGGVAHLTDCLSLPTAAETELYPQHELLRRLECESGTVELEVSFAPRPRYGRDRLRFVRRGKLGWQCEGCAFGAMLGSDIDLAPDEEGARMVGRVRLEAGQSRWLSFSYDESDASIVLPLGHEAEARLQATVGWWKEWSALCRYQGEHRDLVLRSALVLKALSCATSGAVLAAPTTSLPELVGGARNWDYRYCWIRDSALVLHAFLALGYVSEAEGFLEWLLHATRLTWQRFQVMYNLYGETNLTENQLDHLHGYRGSRPVRVGNAAHDQLQLDIYGELMHSVGEYVAAGGGLDPVECDMLSGVARHVKELWRCPDQGIWEARSAPRHHTFSKAMCWVALDRARSLAQRFPMKLDLSALDATCTEIREEIESRGYDEKQRSYRAVYDEGGCDASLLLLARYGYCEPGDARMEGTYRCIERTLVRGGFVHRYDTRDGSDGIHSPENAFAPCSFWAVEYLANAGHQAEAEKLFARLCGYANEVGLFGEEMTSRGGHPAGNFPQALTHVSLISAATALYQRPTA